jgi:hypothetical protein
MQWRIKPLKIRWLKLSARKLTLNKGDLPQPFHLIVRQFLNAPLLAAGVASANTGSGRLWN